MIFIIFTFVLVHHTFGINFSNLHQLLFYLMNLLVVGARKNILTMWKFRKCKPLNYCFVSEDTYKFNRGQLSAHITVGYQVPIF